MNLICCGNKKKNEIRKRHIAPPIERYIQFLNSVIEEKSFDVTKTINYGYFGGNLIVKHDVSNAELKVKIVKEEYVGDKECKWETFNHRNLLPLLKLEYLKCFDSYLFYSSAEETSLEEKISDKYFRKDTQSLWKLLYWLEGIADAVQYLHSNGYGHLNLQAKSMIVTKDDVVQISEFHHLSLINDRTEK